MNTPRFYFSTCQTGAEKAVKAEMLANYPHLKFAFSRPGFITFKDESGEDLITTPPGIFTRLWGEAIGQAKEMNALIELLKGIPAQAIVHSFDRDFHVPGDEPDGFVLNHYSQKLREALSPQFSFRWNAQPKIGETVYDLVWVDDFHVFLGKHTHASEIDVAPGNIPEIQLPDESPSRAYLKIEEAIHRFHPKLQKGMTVLEVGCSPGGASIAMLRKGLNVVGVDPKYMDQKLYKEPNFKFIQKLAKAVTQNDLKEVNPDWIVMDMNIAPLEALDELNHVLLCLRNNFKKELKLHQAFLTIKLNDWKFAESIPLYLKRLEEMGFRNLQPTQLWSNRQEFFVAATFKV